MKNTISFFFLIILLSACSTKKSQLKKIESLEHAILDSAHADMADTASINMLIEAYQDFAAKYPEDSLAPEFLFRTGDFYRAMHKPLRGIEMYKKIYAEYPKYRLHEVSLFLQGFIFENDVQNYDAAKIIYREFLTKHPNHKLAKDVTLSIQNLGKTPEQLYEEMMTRQALDSSGLQNTLSNH